MADPGTMKLLAVIVALLGLWIAVSPFVSLLAPVLVVNNVAVGIAILAIAGYNAYRTTRGRLPHVGAAALVALLGLWMIVGTFLLGPVGVGLLWTNVVPGVIVVAIGASNAVATKRAETTRTRTRA